MKELNKGNKYEAPTVTELGELCAQAFDFSPLTTCPSPGNSPARPGTCNHPGNSPL